MRKKKFMALGLAGLMIISSAMPVFAADATVEPATGTIDGDGDIEGFIDKDVFTVTLPTTANLNFSIDPQELKLAVDPSYEVDGSTATPGYGEDVLFEDSSSKAVTKSQDITVVNKSTFDVDVKVDVAVKGLVGTDEATPYTIELAESEGDFADAPAIALAVKDTTAVLTGSSVSGDVAGTAVNLTGSDSLSYTVAKSSNVDDAYEVTGTKGSYKYSIKGDVSTVPFNQVTLNVSGKVNVDADWTEYAKASVASKSELGIGVTYSVEKHVENAEPTFTSSEVGVIAYTKGAGNAGVQTISKVEAVLNGVAYDALVGNSYYSAATVTSNKIVIDSNFIAFFNANDTTNMTVTYLGNDGETYTKTVAVVTK
ncbi:MAG: hypothetical protein ACI4D4_00570 [Lachnospira sp.]